ncbi:hypothetical protein GJ496_008335 [Pomphorhynchus laevis]|nr:hypothetical protein GJ496_008335 [Pomphorhynchus laevis]
MKYIGTQMIYKNDKNYLFAKLSQKLCEKTQSRYLNKVMKQVKRIVDMVYSDFTNMMFTDNLCRQFKILSYMTRSSKLLQPVLFRYNDQLMLIKLRTIANNSRISRQNVQCQKINEKIDTKEDKDIHSFIYTGTIDSIAYPVQSFAISTILNLNSTKYSFDVKVEDPITLYFDIFGSLILL